MGIYHFVQKSDKISGAQVLGNSVLKHKICGRKALDQENTCPLIWLVGTLEPYAETSVTLIIPSRDLSLCPEKW